MAELIIGSRVAIALRMIVDFFGIVEGKPV